MILPIIMGFSALIDFEWHFVANVRPGVALPMPTLMASMMLPFQLDPTTASLALICLVTIVLPLLPPTQLAMELLLLFQILQLQFQGGKLLQAMILSKSPSPRQLKSFATFRLPLLMQILQLLLVLLEKLWG